MLQVTHIQPQKGNGVGQMTWETWVMDLHSTGPERICIVADDTWARKQNKFDFQLEVKFVVVLFYF